jgi:hypothetical protein
MNGPTRKCERCHHLNPPTGRDDCEKCTEPIDHIEPSLHSEEPQSSATPEPPAIPAPAAIPAQKLELIIADSTREELRHGDIIGRDGTVASQVIYARFGLDVSRQHILVVCNPDRSWAIASSDPEERTKLDGRPMKRLRLETLTGEHCLLLAERCEVTLRVSKPT